MSDICCALICLRTGRVLEVLQGVSSPRVLDLASAASALLGGVVPEPLASAFTRHGSERAQPCFQELSFLSASGAHVLQQLDPERAIIALSAQPENLVAVLSAARARRTARERIT